MKKLKLLFVLLSVFLLSSCIQDFPYDEDWNNSHFELLNQDSIQIVFPDIIKGKLAVVGYIYTNCPDICPLTTNNMRLIRDALKKEGITDVEFVTVSFDPETDRPSVLKKYAELRNIDFSDWQFLTGETQTIKRLMKASGVVAAKGDSTVLNNNEKIYYYVHTDRIALFDKRTHLRKYYFGSTINIDEIINDIKNLED